MPAKASRSHQRGVVTGKGQGKIRLLNEDGEEQEFDGDAAAGEGDDIVFITRGKKAGRFSVTGSTDPAGVDDRLARLAQSNPELAAKISDKQTDIQIKREERLARTLGNAPDDKKNGVQGAIARSKSRGPGTKGDGESRNRGGNSPGGNQGSQEGNPSRGNSSGGNPAGADQGGERGNPGRGNSDSGSSTDSNSGGGNSGGNKGGGNSGGNGRGKG